MEKKLNLKVVNWKSEISTIKDIANKLVVNIGLTLQIIYNLTCPILDNKWGAHVKIAESWNWNSESGAKLVARKGVPGRRKGEVDWS